MVLRRSSRTIAYSTAARAAISTAESAIVKIADKFCASQGSVPWPSVLRPNKSGASKLAVVRLRRPGRKSCRFIRISCPLSALAGAEARIAKSPGTEPASRADRAFHDRRVARVLRAATPGRKPDAPSPALAIAVPVSEPRAPAASSASALSGSHCPVPVPPRRAGRARP